MANSSSSAPASHKYDVFLSFRGEDTRYSFTDHLYKALLQKGITTFRDNDEIREGQELKPEIKRSITKSRASIIVLSENFANSSWCLDELCLILQQKRKRDHLVLPVFYKVDPSHVRNQVGSFSIKAKDGVNGSKWTQNNANRWKTALREVANLKGMIVSGYETAFIANIVHKIYFELGLKHLSTSTDLTGIETRAEGINSWLKHEDPRSSVLAICGMGGSGKTSLAKYIYNSNKHKFESSSFLEEIEKQHDGLLGIQKQLLRDVLGNNTMIFNVSEGTHEIEKAIRRKRVLIVVDDIDDPDKLSTLFGTNGYISQTKIIITTRLLNIDTWFGSISWRCHIHKVELLNCHESLELLSSHAFGFKIPMKGFKELAVQLTRYCGGNPLALKVLGSSLSVKSEDQCARDNMKEIWRSRVNSLNSLKGDLDYKIQDVLQRSFESLPCDSDKELFLHIACFFVGEYASRVEKILENDYHAKYGIKTLINRCLLTKSTYNGRLVMHKLLQDMARKIVREESKDPAKHSRVWHHEESYRLLRKGDGSDMIEGLALDMLKFEEGMKLEAFKTSSLVKMKNLKFLQLTYVKLIGSYENFPELRWLRWRGCNLKTIPPCLLMSCLVAIDMSCGDLEKFEPPVVLNSLKILNLAWSYKLVSVCNLHLLPKLEALDLWNCISLTHVCKSIGELENLYFLELTGCTKLWKTSSNQKFINQLKMLKTLFIPRGIPEQQLLSLPQSLRYLMLSSCDLEHNKDVRVTFHAKSLFHLILSSNSFDTLPNYIDIQIILSLDLKCCQNLKSLPCLPSTLKELHVDWCTSLERITFQSARFTLEKFTYEGCFRLSEIQGLFKLVSISKLDEADLGRMQWIKAYQDHTVDLVGDLITKGRTWNMQMLYEYGIRSTYLQHIKDQSMATHEYTSSYEFLSFRVPSHRKKCRIQGLYVTILYRSSGEDTDMWPPFAKISNRTKGVTWVYSPVVFCKPRVGEDVVWLSYWPIGNILDAGDKVLVNILMYKRMIKVRGCGVSLVYMGDGEVKKGEEVIGGDLSLFEVTKGGYYLCRHDFLKSETPTTLRWLFGDNRLYTDLRRWRASRQALSAYQNVNNFRNPNLRKIEVEVGVSFNTESLSDKIIEKAVSSIVGVESVSTHKEARRLFVCGRFDPQAVETCVREFEKIVRILSYKIVAL